MLKDALGNSAFYLSLLFWTLFAAGFEQALVPARGHQDTRWLPGEAAD